MDPVETHQHIRRLHIYILLLTVSILALIWLLFKDQFRAPKKEEVTPTVSVQKENKGQLLLQAKNNLRTTQVGGAYVVQVLANSEKEDVVGFDVLLSLDQAAFKVTSVTSPLTGYRVFSSPQDNHLAISGIQDPENKNRYILNNEVILEITLSPQKTGEYQVGILPASGPATSKLVTTQTTVLLPEVEDLSVTVE